MHGRRLSVLVALVGVLVVLAFPASGSGLNAIAIALTANGPSPATLAMAAGLYPIWINQDAVAHSVVFANGLCSFQVAPGEIGQCTNWAPDRPGEYPYTVDGTVQASIVVVAEPRTVTLTASSHTVERGAQLRLHGQLTAPFLSPPPTGPTSDRVIVLARPDRHHPFRRIRVVIARGHGTSKLSWQLRVRPRSRTIYIAEANSEHPYWARAWSRSFRVNAHR
ncbi:MAG TPA: hypothetical protein VE220_03495 [Gaiellaceae bacterium]|nr:hypothetical protein [Gaiellaceae bacterium]